MLIQQINADLKQAMLKKDPETVSVLRMLVSSFHNEAIALKKKEVGLNEEEEIKVLKREVKKHRDSIEQYEKGGRPDLAAKEKQELEILNRYLPAEMSEDEVKKVVEEVMAEMGEVAPSQFGMVMKNVMAKIGGKADV